MKVRLIDYTGIGQASPAQYAARLLVYVKNTRLTQGEEGQKRIDEMSFEQIIKEIDEIKNTIRSSWEFIDYTWEITGVTRAFTHQFVRSRHLSFAQQAMRVADMGDFDSLIPSQVEALGFELDWKEHDEDTAGFYREMRAAGVAAQDARGILPTNVLTNIIAKANLRSLSELVGKRLNLRVQDEYQNVIKDMARCAEIVHPWIHEFLFPNRLATPMLDSLLSQALNGRSPVDAPEINAALKELDKVKATWG